MFQPQGAGTASLRLPPRWEPGLENSLPFRVWLQDLMLWTIGTDLQPHQQCAAIIQQLGGAARELARSLTPAEVYQGGVVNGVQLDPVSYLLHGLSSRFGPLDEESRLRATQDLLSFARRQGETVDTLISRFELVRSRARTEGGGVVSVESAALILLRACGVSSEQFQTLTQPFGLRLPGNDAEFAQLQHHMRRMGHIVERFPNNIAAGLRQSAPTNHAFLAEADTGSSRSGDVAWISDGQVSTSAPLTGGQWGTMMEGSDWAFHADPAAESDTDTATSSDNDEAMQTDDIQGMSAPQVDEYLFGRYQEAKRRWRRFSGKPVRALRRVLKRKGKGKGKGYRGSYLNIDGLLQQSSYFKGKGKGGKSSGKGFGRKINPCGRDGEPLKCSVCGSAYHLRARCPRAGQNSTAAIQPTAASAAPAPRAPAFVVEPTSSLHFASFDDSSWDNITTPRSQVSAAPAPVPAAQALRQQASAQQADVVEPQARNPEVHNLSPDPWTINPDPWARWLHEQPSAPQAAVQPSVPQISTSASNTWSILGLGNVGPAESFSQSVGLTREPPPISGSSSSQANSPWPTWYSEIRQPLVQLQAAAQSQQPAVNTVSTPQVPTIFRVPSGVARVSAAVTSTVPEAPSPPQELVGRAGSNPVNVFSQVYALRASAPSTRGAAPQAQPTSSTVPTAPVRLTRPFQGRTTTCTVCLEDFLPGDHVGRLTCGHVFHCICLGELAMHNPTSHEPEQLSVECPNCREQATVGHAWHYPRLITVPGTPTAEDTPLPEAEAGELTATPQPQREDTGEFLSPESHQAAFPWWPVPDLPADTSTQPDADIRSQSYHTSVRLASGRVGLLIDPGSYGNLVGEEWLIHAAAQMQREPGYVQRAQPLQVGGVGKGAQMCNRDCRLPIAISRQDGSTALGTFSSPVVSSSGCPALLGLRSLQENRAILDLSRNQLHFAGPGDITLVLPSGSETYQFEVARSGHLLLPCDAFNAVPDGAIAGEHHLFAAGRQHEHQATLQPGTEAVETVSTAATGQTSLLPVHTIPRSVHLGAEEDACCRVLRQFTWPSATELLTRLVTDWYDAELEGAPRRVSVIFGLSQSNDADGKPIVSHGRPQLTRLLSHTTPCSPSYVLRLPAIVGRECSFQRHCSMED